MEWRRLKPNAFDAERTIGLWGFSLLFVSSFIAIKILPGVPARVCRFYRLTGIPCPACGSSRAFRHLLAGRISDAFSVQPLMTALALLYTLYAVYACIVVAAGLPRLRGVSVPGRTRTWLLGGLLLIVANWAYVVYRHLVFVS